MAQDLINDPGFMLEWAGKLNSRNRSNWNVFHSFARRSRSASIKALGEIFGQEHKEMLKQALKATDTNGKTPLDLAEDAQSRKALTDLLQQ